MRSALTKFTSLSRFRFARFSTMASASNASLFAGISAALDRSCTFSHDGASISRTSPNFLPALLASKSARALVLTPEGKVGVYTCSTCKRQSLAQLPLGWLASQIADDGNAEAAFRARCFVVGAWSGSDGAATAYPLAAAEVIGDAGWADLISKIAAAPAGTLSCQRAGCSCACRDPASSLRLSEGRELLFARTFAAAAASVAAPAAAAAGDAADIAAAAAAPPAMLRPSEIEWAVPFEEAAVFGLARTIVAWRAQTKFCGSCGAPLVSAEGGAKKVCSRAAEGCRTSSYPRVDPVAITLVRNAADTHVLLGRQPGFPPGWYSCLAGFLENGETVEDAAAREVHEESGVRLADVKYVTSQPWPIGRGAFGQLMLGCAAVAVEPSAADLAARAAASAAAAAAAGGAGAAGADAAPAPAAAPASVPLPPGCPPLLIDRTELEDARWFSREDVAAAVAAHFAAPRPRSGSKDGSSSKRSGSPERFTGGSGSGTAPTAGTSTTGTAPVAGGAAARSTSPSRSAGSSAEVQLRVPGPYAVAHMLMQSWLRGELGGASAGAGGAGKLA